MWQENFLKGEKEAVERYFAKLLESIRLPIELDKAIEVIYDALSKQLIVELFLPSKEDIPRLKSVRYIKSRKEFTKTFYTDAYINKKYDRVIYQIVLVFLNYIFFNWGKVFFDRNGCI